MAEPFAAAALQAEEDQTNPPDSLIIDSKYTPAWVQGHQNLGEEQQKTADVQRNVGFTDAVGMALSGGSNIAVQLYKDIDRIAASGDVDPQWDRNVEDFLKLNRQRIRPEDDWRYRQANNATEADAILRDKEANAQTADILARRGGVSTFIAEGLAGIVDIDAPLTFMSGGLSAAAKTGINATKLGRLASGVAVGALTGSALGAVDYTSDPNADWTVIPLMGLGGAVFGAAGGLLSHGPVAEANLARERTLNEFGETLADGHPRAKEDLNNEVFSNTDTYMSERGAVMEEAAKAEAEAAVKQAPTTEGRQPQAVNIDDIERQSIPDIEVDPDIGKGSIGARQLTQVGPGVSSIRSQKVVDTIQNARTRIGQLGIAREWTDGYADLISKAGPLGKAAARFQDAINASPIATDFARMMNSGSAVAQSLAYDLLENASGIIRNGRSAARLQDHYRVELASQFQDFHDHFGSWARTQKGAGELERLWSSDLKEAFHREVIQELQTRYHDGQPGNANVYVRAAADSVDRVFAKEIDVVRGRPGETPVFGANNLTQKSGYMPQKWSGRNIRNLIETGRYTEKDIIDALAESYQKQHPFMSKSDAKIYADATVTRARNSDLGVSTSVIGVLQGDGRIELEDVLKRNGMSQTEVDKFIDRLTGTMQERGKASHMKMRLDVDLRDTASNGVKIMDLVDTDLSTMVPNRIRRSAGAAALARKGIASRADWEDLKRAILEEQRANGVNPPTGTGIKDKIDDYIDKDKHVDAEFLDGIYSYFSGGPIAGGISPSYARIRKLTNLALLNKLGLTQVAEFGANIASVGVQQFFRHAGSEIRDALKDVNSPLVKELRHMGSYAPEERLFRDDLIADFERHSAQGEYARQADKLLNKATRLQGWTSGFFAMRRLQQRIAVTSAADQLAQHFHKGGLISDQRLVDMGFTKKDLAALEGYAKNGTIEFNPDGSLKKLNIDKWKPEDAEIFTLSLNARVNTLVQKAMAGESSMVFHKDGMAQLFWHLKSFPMLALEKQALRGLRMADQKTAMEFMYGLATAAAAYSAIQVVNNKTENLEFGKIAKGAFNMANLTGWIPMWTDPLAMMLGLDEVTLNSYGSRGGGQIISVPAAFETLDRMARIPGALASSVAGGPSNKDINALTAIPLVGNAYAFSAIFNEMRRDNKAEKDEEARQKRKEREKKKAEEAAQQQFVEPLDEVLPN